MSERRRSLFVLLVVAVLIGGSLYVALTRSTKLGLDLQGGVQLVYHAEPTAQQKTVDADSMQRSIDLMEQRVNSFGVNEAAINQAGDDQIEVNLPGVKDAERAAQQVGSTAQLYFYDWEKNVLDENCKTDDTQINGGQQPISGLYQAVKQAAKCPAQNDGNNKAAAAPRYYSFDKVSKKPYNGGLPDDSRSGSLEGLTAAQKERAEVIEVKPGILVLRDQKASANAPAPDAWWVIR